MLSGAGAGTSKTVNSHAAQSNLSTITGQQLVASWLGGALATEPSEVDSDNIALTQQYNAAISIAFDPDCPNYANLVNLQNKMKALFKAKVHALQSAQEAYLALQETNLNTAAISANDAIQALNNISQAALAITVPAASMLEATESVAEQEGGALASQLAGSGVTVGELNDALGIVYALPQTIANFVSNYLSQPSDASDALATAISISTPLTTAMEALAGTGSPFSAVASQMLQLWANVHSAFANFKVAQNNVNGALNAVEQADNNYRSALIGLKNAVNTFSLIKGSCPPPPPPPTPPPTLPIVVLPIVIHLPGDPNGITGPAGYSSPGPQWVSGNAGGGD